MKKLASIDQPLGFVLLGDVRGSRERGSPSAGREELRRRVESVNARFAAALRVPFSISRGDEIQALLADPDALWEIVEHLDLEAGPPLFRFGCGVGAVETALAARTWEMDGACFHRARAAVDRAKEERRWCAFAGCGPALDAGLDALARAMQVMREAWTDRQREALVARRAHPSQKTAAAAMGIDPTTLSKMLSAAHAKAYREIAAAATLLLQMGWEDALVTA